MWVTIKAYSTRMMLQLSMEGLIFGTLIVLPCHASHMPEIMWFPRTDDSFWRKTLVRPLAWKVCLAMMAALGTTMREQVFSNLALIQMSSPSQKPRLSILAFNDTWPSGMNMQVTFFSFIPPVGAWEDTGALSLILLRNRYGTQSPLLSYTKMIM